MNAGHAMNDDVDAWDRLADLVAYPEGDDVDAPLARCVEGVAAIAPDAAAALLAFKDLAGTMSIERLREAYVDAFDLDPACSLELGWHLVGDGPDRGALLSALREELVHAGIRETGGLPDHLGHLLRLVAREPDPDAAGLAGLIDPALARVHDALARRDSPYVHLIDAARRLIAARAPRPEARGPRPEER